MADKTAIEWTATINPDGSTTPGATWNPTRGCSRVSPGCGGPGPHGGCYAEIVAARFSGPGQPYEGLAHRVGGQPRWTGKVRLIDSMLDQPLRWKRPRRIFVNSMSDLFHESLPDEAIDRVFAVMALAPQHTFMVLTKRAERMRSYMCDGVADRVGGLVEDALVNDEDWVKKTTRLEVINDGYNGCERWPLRNVWLGVSVEDQERADERVPPLLATPAAVRFLSCEPLLGPVDLHEYLLGFSAGHPAACVCGHGHGFTRCPNYGKVSPTCHRCDCRQFRKERGGDGLSWAIIGGESGPRARMMDVAWARSLLAQCKAAGVPAFMKQVGSYPVNMDPVAESWQGILERKGGNWDAWPADLRVREFPA